MKDLKKNGHQIDSYFMRLVATYEAGDEFIGKLFELSYGFWLKVGKPILCNHFKGGKEGLTHYSVHGSKVVYIGLEALDMVNRAFSPIIKVNR